MSLPSLNKVITLPYLTKPTLDFRISKPRKRIVTPKLLLTLVLLWTGKGHYRRYFYVRPVLKTLSKENCGRHFLRNIIYFTDSKENVNLDYASMQSRRFSFRRVEVADYMLIKNQKKKTDSGYVRGKYRGPLLDLWDLPLQNPSTIIPQYVRLTFYLQLMFESPHYICVAVQRVRRPDKANVKNRLQFDLFVLLILFIFLLC